MAMARRATDQRKTTAARTIRKCIAMTGCGLDGTMNR
jgi:hypothetical protein